MLERALADLASVYVNRMSVKAAKNSFIRTSQASDSVLGSLKGLDVGEPTEEMVMLVVLQKTNNLHAACGDGRVNGATLQKASWTYS